MKKASVFKCIEKSLVSWSCTKIIISYLYFCNWDSTSVCSKLINIIFQECFANQHQFQHIIVEREGSCILLSIHIKGLSCLRVIIVYLLWVGHWRIILEIQTNSYLIFKYDTQVYCSPDAYLIYLFVLI